MSTPSGINLSSLRRRRSSHSTGPVEKECLGQSSEEVKKKKVVEEGTTYTASHSNFQEGKDSFGHFVKRDENSLCPSAALISTASGDASHFSSACLKEDFYDVPCEKLARDLLGKMLARRLENGQILKGRIVETECYLGGEDQASHSYRGRMTERNAPMFMKPGTTYVYFTYGMYHCFNISSQGPGAAVLIRAVEPVEGLEVMAELRARGAKNKKQPQQGEGEQRKGGKKKTPLKPHELCNGPSKLCIAMDIDRDSCNKRDLASWPGLYIEVDSSSGGDPGPIVVSKRIGIESAGSHWAAMPLRFYLLGNAAVSKRDRAREKELAA